MQEALLAREVELGDIVQTYGATGVRIATEHASALWQAAEAGSTDGQFRQVLRRPTGDVHNLTSQVAQDVTVTINSSADVLEDLLHLVAAPAWEGVQATIHRYGRASSESAQALDQVSDPLVRQAMRVVLDREVLRDLQRSARRHGVYSVETGRLLASASDQSATRDAMLAALDRQLLQAAASGDLTHRWMVLGDASAPRLRGMLRTVLDEQAFTEFQWARRRGALTGNHVGRLAVRSAMFSTFSVKAAIIRHLEAHGAV